MKKVSIPNKRKIQTKTYVGTWVTGADYAALKDTATKNQRTVAGELRHRIQAAIRA